MLFWDSNKFEETKQHEGHAALTQIDLDKDKNDVKDQATKNKRHAYDRVKYPQRQLEG